MAEHASAGRDGSVNMFPGAELIGAVTFEAEVGRGVGPQQHALTGAVRIVAAGAIADGDRGVDYLADGENVARDAHFLTWHGGSEGMLAGVLFRMARLALALRHWAVKERAFDD